MFCAIVIFVLAAIVIIQNRAALYGDLEQLKQAWGKAHPPSDPPDPKTTAGG